MPANSRWDLIRRLRVNLLARVSAKNCLRTPAWASFAATCLIKHKQLSDWCMAKAPENVFFTGVRAAIQAQPLAKNRPNPSAWQTLSQTDTNNLAVYTRTNVHIYCKQTPIFITRSPKFILNSTECNFACLSAEYISDLASNQDKW